MRTIFYKGHKAAVAYDADAGLFHGEVANIRDVITFQAKSEADLEAAFAASLDDYLALCELRGEAPATP